MNYSMNGPYGFPPNQNYGGYQQNVMQSQFTDPNYFKFENNKESLQRTNAEYDIKINEIQQQIQQYNEAIASYESCINQLEEAKTNYYKNLQQFQNEQNEIDMEIKRVEMELAKNNNYYPQNGFYGSNNQ